jgi:hypothetical protein
MAPQRFAEWRLRYVITLAGALAFALNGWHFGANGGDYRASQGPGRRDWTDMKRYKGLPE